MNKTKLLVLLSAMTISTFSSAAAMWGTRVHAHLLDLAFPFESSACRAQMKAGSVLADSMDFQGEEYTFMHAMRTAEQTPEEAEKLMWGFIRKKYATIRKETALYTRNPKKAAFKMKSCFNRGMALHPVMDMSSPSHSGFKIWDPSNVAEALLHHGEAREFLVEKVGFSLGVPHSHEDMDTLNKMPTLKKSTLQAMREVDSELLLGDADNFNYDVIRIKR